MNNTVYINEYVYNIHICRYFWGSQLNNIMHVHTQAWQAVNKHLFIYIYIYVLYTHSHVFFNQIFGVPFWPASPSAGI